MSVQKLQSKENKVMWYYLELYVTNWCIIILPSAKICKFNCLLIVCASVKVSPPT